MPRKRSTAGRSRTSTQSLITMVNQVNRQLRKLERSGEYGKYASKEVIRTAKESKKLSYKRKGARYIRISKRAKFTPIEQRAIKKKLSVFLTSKLGKAHQIKKIRAETRKLVKARLQGLRDKELTNKDIDEFYELTHDEDFRYLADKISDSDVYVLLEEVKESGGDADDLIEKLQQFMIFSNSSEAAEKAKRLYNKWK